MMTPTQAPAEPLAVSREGMDGRQALREARRAPLPAAPDEPDSIATGRTSEPSTNA